MGEAKGADAGAIEEAASGFERAVGALSPVQQVAVIGMAAGVVTVATATVQIPVPATGGYLNLGDVAVMLTAFLLGARAGGMAGALGSALADLIAGYAAFIPITLVAKGAEGWIAGQLGGPGRSWASRLAGGVLAGVVMAVSYGLWDLTLLGLGPALATLPGNLIQGAVGVSGALALRSVVVRQRPS